MNQVFNFSNKVEDFTTKLGHLCPDKYAHVIGLGDTVEIGKKVYGLNLETGVVVKILKPNKSISSIIEKLKGYSDIEEEDYPILDKNFDHWGQSFQKYLYSDAMPCIVKIEQEVEINNKFIHSVNDEIFTKQIENESIPFIEFEIEQIKFKFKRLIGKKFILVCKLKCFIDGDSVVSTKAIDEFKEYHAKNSVIENVAWSDTILSKKLLKEMNSEIDKICQNEPADYHPGSGKVVRDIVHPSLYPYIKNFSLVEESSVSSYKPTQTEEECFEVDFWGRSYEDSIYQWLPAEYHVSKEGKVSIDSYINNLDRHKYLKTYGLLEEMFESILPMFEAVCGSLRNDFYGNDVKYKQEKAINLRGRNLQVVTKIVEYRVNEEANFDGVWHVEGMSHENILATGLCIIKRDSNFKGAEIEFRRYLFEKEGDDLIYATPQNANRPTDMMGGGDVRPLGTIKTSFGRAMVFPNSHIHRVSKMYSKDGNDAVRRIVVFWLVNPEKPIVSTANVREQQKVMSFSDAKKHRLALMAERKLHKDNFSEREVFLCEH